MPVFTTSTRIEAPIERCFDLASSVDLHTLALSHSGERAVAGKVSGLLYLGDEVTWEASHFGVRHRLTSRIVEFDRPRRFTVRMLKGPFASHTHNFTFDPDDGEATVMTEVFQFRSPFGILGRIMDALVMTRYLKRLMRTRNEYLKRVAEGREPEHTD
jgi:ligand-binding SRPBCC domain-containing protein